MIDKHSIQRIVGLPYGSGKGIFLLVTCARFCLKNFSVFFYDGNITIRSRLYSFEKTASMDCHADGDMSFPNIAPKATDILPNSPSGTS